jgi:PST family polysaccharide transporter
MYERIKAIIKNHTLVIKNYFFMTILQFLNGFFYFLIFPYLINTIGKEGYGLYIFSLSVTTFFITFIDYGFSFPGVKAIAENQTNKDVQSLTISTIITAKIFLFLITIPVFILVIFLIPMLREQWWIYALCFIQAPANILFQSWFFQGIQKMKYVTLVQFVSKLISLIFILSFVKTGDDLWLFVLITAGAVLLGSIVGCIMTIKEGIRITLVSAIEVKSMIKEATPFFFSIATGIIKQQTNTIILGTCFSMGNVAVYDLASKIIAVPIALLNSVSGALFPKVVEDHNIQYIKKLIKFIVFLGLFAIITVVIFGKYVILFLGGEQMLTAYPFAIILSITILSWIVVGAYINFLFVPKNLYYIVTKNQLVAFISYFATCLTIIFMYRSVFAVAIAMAISGICELIYCNVVIKRLRLFYKI